MEVKNTEDERRDTPQKTSILCNYKWTPYVTTNGHAIKHDPKYPRKQIPLSGEENWKCLEDHDKNHGIPGMMYLAHVLAMCLDLWTLHTLFRPVVRLGDAIGRKELWPASSKDLV